MFSTTSQDLKKSSCKFRSNCQISLWTLINCFFKFVTLDDKGKNGPKFFVTLKKDFSWNIVFYRPLRSRGSDFIICTNLVKILCVPWQTDHWRLSCSIKWEILGQNVFFTGTIAFYQKLVVSTTSQVLRNSSYHFHINFQNVFCPLISCFLTFFMFDKTKKVCQNLFCTWEFACFSTTSKVLKTWSYNFHIVRQNTCWTLTNCPLS